MNTEKMRCAITGSTGFIGSILLPHLHRCGHDVLSWPRSDVFNLRNGSDNIPEEWVRYLQNTDVVIHLAGLAHQRKGAQDSSHYFQINRDGTLHLAAAAQAAGVKRFIFLSSAKVFGEGGDTIYDANSQPEPADAYAQSKWQAEQQLIEQLSKATPLKTMEIVILRPPLVYGRNAKANFSNLIKLAHLPIPLPFADINNQRAMISIDNLVDLIIVCLTSPAAAGKTFACADAKLYSLTDVIVSIRRAIDRDPNIFRLPSPLLTALHTILGSAASARLFGNFKMDCRKTYETLDWKPPFTMEQTLRGNTWSSR